MIQSVTKNPAPPVGPSTTLAVASLTLGILGLFTGGLCGVGSLIGMAMGLRALARARTSPEQYGGRGLARAGVALNLAALLMAVWIFYLLSTKNAPVPRNESATIGDTRMFISAQAAYREANGGYYDTLECLNKPEACIPGYRGPIFLPDTSVAGDKWGYRRTFHPGPPIPGRPAGISPTSLRSFALVAIPLAPGKTGTRSFCGDSTGRVCYNDPGSIIVATSGLCPATCTDLR